MTATVAPQAVAHAEPDVAPSSKRARLAIIATKGSLDWAYPSPDGPLVAYGISAGGRPKRRTGPFSSVSGPAPATCPA